MEDKIIRGVEIGDIHFGCSRSEDIFRNELPMFIEFIKNNDIDIININGDYFDRPIALTEQIAKYANRFFAEIVKVCKEKNIKLRVLKGTESHERDQLDNFYCYKLEKDLDLEIFNTVTEENICGMNVLYIPEEYVKDYKEYYAPFMKKKYNMIHGHGTWSFVSFESQKENSNKTDITTAPVFDFKDWEFSLGNEPWKGGCVLFNHIHARNIYKNKIFYPGSFSRWNFVDPSEKGFIYYEYNVTKQEYSIKMIDNKIAPAYETYKISSLFKDISSAKLEEIKALIEGLNEKIEFLRIDTNGLDPMQIEFVKKTFGSIKGISIYSTKEKEILLTEDEDYEKKADKFSYIKDKSLPMEVILQKFLKDVEEYDMPIERIMELCDIKQQEESKKG